MAERAYIALREKYRSLHALRVASCAPSSKEPPVMLAELATRFPGALRELDDLPLEEIESRMTELDAIIEQGAPPPVWARLFVRYHGTMRAALRIRRAMRAHPGQNALTEYVPESDEPARACWDPQTLKDLTTPPGGRLNRWAFEYIGRYEGLSSREVEQILFPAFFERVQRSGRYR